MTNKSSPLYVSIAEELSNKILSNYFKEGELLPTELQLCRYFNVSRVTIRQSLQLLVEKGFVEKKQGSGTKVIYSKQIETVNRSSKITSFTEEILASGKKPSSKIITFQLEKASKTVASKLNITAGNPVFFYERIIFSDNLPCSLEKGYLSASDYPDFSVNHLMQSKFHYIEQIKHQIIDYSHQTVDAILANHYLARKLSVPVNTPLVKLNLITFLKNGQVLDYNTIIFDSTRYHAHFIKYR
ncbi:GntR family transcriptional regulator [Vagococcus humatus]|uniref:HTH gntR-type domain-containing protein n=1 Tax=Vagococcus humatus TaxID=1889241 RepID=A0A3S0AWZ0_9ENTE|nr:GntR family transcriptional regulator [Vagococcus humatus]RST89080.1 hypothetical protein C7P63_07265 [Vagococcus humatus]